MIIEAFKQTTFRIRFFELLVKAMMILIIWGCSTKSPEPEFHLGELNFDYHYMKYATLKSSDTLYSPENVILIFEVYNPTQTRLDFNLYSKRNRKKSLSAFCFLYKGDTIVLRSIKDELTIHPNEAGRVYTEFPFETYEPMKEIFKAALSEEETSSQEQFRIIFKKQLSGGTFSSVNLKKAKAKLTCSDTTLAVQMF